MKILIVGLGLIGASYAKGLKEKGHIIYGCDINKETITYALDNNIVNYASLDPKDYINKVDLIILGLYPKLILDFINKYNYLFKKGQIITDVCGVKSFFLKDAIKLSNPATYISHHPMAGREKSGIEYADNKIFNGMNFLIINESNKEEDLNILRQIGKDLGFGTIKVVDKTYHDKMIGFTSQLTHAIAVSLVNSDKQDDTKNFIGDSYRDLTRIAMINEQLWSELFFTNKEFLIDEITNFEIELNKLKQSLINNDERCLKEIFTKSSCKRKEMEK